MRRRVTLNLLTDASRHFWAKKMKADVDFCDLPTGRAAEPAASGLGRIVHARSHHDPSHV
jgi:hypothetical protein